MLLFLWGFLIFIVHLLFKFKLLAQKSKLNLINTSRAYFNVIGLFFIFPESGLSNTIIYSPYCKSWYLPLFKYLPILKYFNIIKIQKIIQFNLYLNIKLLSSGSIFPSTSTSYLFKIFIFLYLFFYHYKLNYYLIFIVIKIYIIHQGIENLCDFFLIGTFFIMYFFYSNLLIQINIYLFLF